MYNQYWGFREKPFKLVPNPDFLFLSATHEEALAHLKFALREGEGFLMITGEVGTGKSTLCRAFLQEIDASVACAYIFNPKLNALQLLKSINAEFGLAAEADTPHELIETLNAFVIERQADDQKVVIIIDEAQNLSVESLEQIRLLSNLETTRDKLLQIVLVGQPELAKMIDSFALRQLGQRISLACQLRPLAFDETVQYIQHRLNVASLKPQMPFDKGALKIIFAHSQGIPRLINTACDRMLLAACLKEHSTITRRLAAEIVTELTDRSHAPPPASRSLRRVGLAVGLLLLVAAAVWAVLNRNSLLGLVAGPADVDRPAVTAPDRPEMNTPLDQDAADAVRPNAAEASIRTPAAATAAARSPSAIASTAPLSLETLTARLRAIDSRRLAVTDVLQRWGLEVAGDMALAGVDDPDYFQLIAERHGLSILVVENNLDVLAKLNLPAIIQLTPDKDVVCYASLVGLEGAQFVLSSGNVGVRVPVTAAMLRAIWGGVALVPWKNYLGYRGVIPSGTPRASVVVLKQLLWELGYSHLTIDDRYDAPTRNAIREIQARNSLAADGLVGDLTKIVLFNEKPGLPIPRLRQ